MSLNDKPVMRYVGIKDPSHVLLFPDGPGTSLRASSESLEEATLTPSGDYEVTQLDDDRYVDQDPRVVTVSRDLMQLARSMIASAPVGPVDPIELPRQYSDQSSPQRPPRRWSEGAKIAVTDGGRDSWEVTYEWTHNDLEDDDRGPQIMSVWANNEAEALREAHLSLTSTHSLGGQPSYKITALARDSEIP